MNAGYAIELVAIIGVAIGAAWVGDRTARASRRWGAIVLTLGVGAFMLHVVAVHGATGLLALPQPFACTIDLVHAIGFATVGAAMQLLPSRRGRGAMLLTLAVLASIHCFRFHVALLAHAHRYAALAGVVHQGHLAQSAPFSCMPACVAVLLDAHGISADEGTLAVECRTTVFGTDLFRTVRAIEGVSAAGGHPLVCRYRRGLRAEDLVALESAAIVSVRLGALGHAITVTPAGDGELFVADPMWPERQTLSLEDFARRYAWKGDALWAEVAR